MSVFTPVNKQQLVRHLEQYNIGKLLAFEGIAAGVENSNFFVTSEQGEFVLTLFESHGEDKLTFYLGLMEHLAAAAIPTIKPLHASDGRVLLELKHKPSAMFIRLAGTNPDNITRPHCDQIGNMLARFHLAVKNYPKNMPNEFGHNWQQTCASNLYGKLSTSDAALLQNELAYQSDLQAQLQALPAGIIHADLFRDNTLFTGSEKNLELSAILDLYTACNDSLLMDLAIVLNDWCFDARGELDTFLAKHLIKAYQTIRPMQKVERQLFNAVLRAAALRFWILRLDLKYNPRTRYNEQCSESGNDYNPDEYRDKLLTHIRQNYETIIR